MNKVNAKIGTDYKLVQLLWRTGCDRSYHCNGFSLRHAEETIDYLNAKGGKYGLIKGSPLQTVLMSSIFLRLCRRQSRRFPSLTVQKSPAALGEPLYLDIVAALRDTEFDTVPIYHRPLWPRFKGHHAGSDYRRLPQHGDPLRRRSVSPSALTMM